MRIHILGFLLLCLSSTAIADLYTDAVDRRDFEMLMHTFSEAKVEHPALIGRIDDAALLSRMSSHHNYDALLAATSFIKVLSEDLSKGVHDHFPKARTFVYSHSSLLHMRQLVSLLDSEDEPGLLEDSWWQPFYYTDNPLVGCEPISLIVVASGTHEATLTVLEEKSRDVLDALADDPWSTRADRVWVNPAFYRFLGGDYK